MFFSHNKCAAGSGEFLVQLIGRLGLTLEDAIQRSYSGKVVPLASRCSVHCKSDVTHKLNRHEASVEDILHTLHSSMAGKVVALLEKLQGNPRRVLLVGGVSQNAALVAALKERRPAMDFVVRPESAWFDAWGCALLERDDPRHKIPHTASPYQLSRLPPLVSYAKQVCIIPAPAKQAAPNGPLVLGVDAGSTTTKVVLIDSVSHSTCGIAVSSHKWRSHLSTSKMPRKSGCGAWQSAGGLGCSNRLCARTGWCLPWNSACL